MENPSYVICSCDWCPSKDTCPDYCCGEECCLRDDEGEKE